MNKRFLILTVILILLFRADNVKSQNDKPDTSLKGLTVNSPAERRNNADAFIQSRQETINQLILLASKDEKRPDINSSKELAIELLGEMRASESAQILVDQIALKVPVIVTAIIPFQDFPALRALIKIGNPSIEAIFRRLSPLEHLIEPTPLRSRDLHLFALVIREVDGDEFGLFRLQLALKNARTEKQKKSFGELIEIYKKSESEFDIRDAVLTKEPEKTLPVAAQAQPQPAPQAPAPK